MGKPRGEADGSGETRFEALGITLVRPAWPAPRRVRAYTTTRLGGHSTGAYAGLNLGLNVGDDPRLVEANRARVREALQLRVAPKWLEQVHGITVVNPCETGNRRADGAWTSQTDVVCAVLSADCLPIILADRDGSRVAAVHGGWRGLCNGIVEAALDALALAPDRVLAWIGPGIGATAYEVGPEVRDAFLRQCSLMAHAFAPTGPGRWLADLNQLATLRLSRRGVTSVYYANACAFEDAAHFYSHRRDGITGRFATLIWLDDSACPSGPADYAYP